MNFYPWSITYNLSSVADPQRDDFKNALNKLSEVVATEGCKYALRYQLAQTASCLKQQYGQLRLYAYLAKKKENAKRELYFVTQQQKVLKNHPEVNIEALRDVVRRIYSANLQTSTIATAAGWFLNDDTINTSKTELETVLQYLKDDAETVLQFVKDKSVSQFLKVEDEVSDDGVDDGLSNDPFEFIMHDARDNMQTLFGKCFHREQLLRKSISVPGLVQPAINPPQSQHVLAATDAIALANASEQVRNTFEAFAVSSYQNNCMFQALSLCLTDFTDQSYDIELRARTCWQLIDDWHNYSTDHYDNNEAGQTEALENLLWSLRRFNAFSCRLMYAIPQVVNKNIDMLVVSRNMRELSLRLQAANNLAGQEKLYLATTRECDIELDERNERMFHVVPLRKRPNANADGLQLAEAGVNLPLLGVYCRFSGRESDKSVSVSEDRSLLRPVAESKFDWQLYRQTLKNYKANMDAPDAEQAAVNDSVPMSIYGSNTKVMRREYERLQTLFVKNADVKRHFAATAEHLKQEIERLELLKTYQNPAMVKAMQQFEKRARKAASEKKREARALFKERLKELKHEDEVFSFANWLSSTRKQAEAKFKKELLDIESEVLTKAVKQYSVGLERLIFIEQPTTSGNESETSMDLSAGQQSELFVADNSPSLEVITEEYSGPKLSEVEAHYDCSVAAAKMPRLNKIPFSDLAKQRNLSDSAFSVLWKTGNQVVVFKKISSPQNLKEAVLLSQLNHRNIVKFIGVVTDIKDHGIVTEYIENGTLFDFLHGSRHAEVRDFSGSEDSEEYVKIHEARRLKDEFDFSRVLSMASDVASGMNYLHSEAPMQVVHRNLKSSHVLLTKDLQCKICGFGSAHLGGGRYGTQLSDVGAPSWTAPEVIRGEGFDVKTDVYSFGVVMWELITLEVPYATLDVVQIMFNVACGGERLPIGRNCPTDLAELMHQCWKQQDERPSFSAILTQLTEMAGNAQLIASANAFMADRVSIERENEAFYERIRAK